MKDKKILFGTTDWWWLRSASSNTTDAFLVVDYSGDWVNNSASYTNGVAPAFRIGQHFLNKTSPHQIKRGLARKRNVK